MTGSAPVVLEMLISSLHGKLSSGGGGGAHQILSHGNDGGN